MNYLSYFGLKELPFSITPDTSFFFSCRGSQAALNTLLVAITNGEGFIKITGEVGSGKTVLCRKLLVTLDKRFVTAYIPNPSFPAPSLMLALAEELNVPLDPAGASHRLLRALTSALVDLAAQSKRVVLCLDESQAMPLETLEAVRLLTNLETEKRKLLQVVLFGQPELDRKLEMASIRQLRQRIVFEQCLDGLEEDEVGAYVGHRLAVAGYSGMPLVKGPALRLLHRASRGLPRLVNILMHKSLLLAYGDNSRTIGKDHLATAVADTPSATQMRRWWPLLRPAG
jgi:MSHA biogenesis protein MshM